MRALLCATAALVFVAAPLAHAEDPFSFDKTPGKLPKSVVPQAYRLRLAPDLERKTFAGEVSTLLEVRAPTSELVLNAAALEIDSATLVTDAGPRKLTPELDAERQILRFDLDERLAPGVYTLDIAYRGVINQGPQGLFYLRYQAGAAERTMLSSQLEPVDARRVLPCWDEPSFRAAFELSVDLPADLQAYSNTRAVKRERLAGNLRRTRFAPTPKMASYLLVLTAGRLESLKGEQDGVQLEITTTEGKRATARYALETTRRVLSFFNDYFGVAYPLPKLDQFALPGSIGFAMENWGGITYGESILLFDPRTSAERTRRSIHSVVAHEIAHQWFGNLVTMAWWDNLWLNEGFASWMATKTMDRLQPDWKVWQSANEGREFAMSLDARRTTHPIQQPVASENQALDAFDEITYSKGQAFLRMLESWLGEDPFRAGIRAYLQRHQYSNTTTADLWIALEQASGQPVRRMAQGWTEQPGFPVVRVAARCEGGARRIELSQEHFSAEGRPERRLWAIPVSITAGATRGFELLDGRALAVTRAGCDGPIVADADALGYFRVEYAAELLAELTAAWPKLSPETQLKLLSDTWALAGVGRVTLAQHFRLLEQARSATEPAIQGAVLDQLRKLDRLARNEPQRPRLRQYAVGLLKPWLARLGWETRARDSQQVRELRPRLIAALGRYGDAAVRAEAQRRFRRFLANPSTLPAALADPVMVTAGRYADDEVHQALERKARAATAAEEQERYVGSLAAAEDPVLARKTLALALDPALPPSLATDIPALVADGHLELAWTFAKEHHERLGPLVPAWRMNRYFGDIVGEAADERLAEDLVDWGDDNLPDGARPMNRRVADAIRFNARLKQRLLPQLEQAL
jgi:aminopeptidase N